MASGVNTTLRQIGIALGIALYGTIFSSALQIQLHHSLVPLRLSAGDVNAIVTNGKVGYASRVIASTPAGARGVVIGALRSCFAGSLNDLLIVSGVIDLVGAL
ncbi:MAG: hypothetical protein ACRDVC_11655 [Acidimicrobiales bacterium]